MKTFDGIEVTVGMRATRVGVQIDFKPVNGTVTGLVLPDKVVFKPDNSSESPVTLPASQIQYSGSKAPMQKKILIIAGSAVGALGLGALAYFKFKKKGRK